MIVGFQGKKFSGKSTAALILQNEGFDKLSFADTLKKMVVVFLRDLGLDASEVHVAVYGTDEDKNKIIPKLGVSSRHIMQTLGTEWGRQCIHKDVWIMTTEQAIKELGDNADVVFDDVRFDNEVEMIHRRNGTLIELRSPDTENNGDTHASELGTSYPADSIITNHKNSTDELEAAIFDALTPL